MWDLPSSFPGQPVLNRGFGGSELSDAIRYFDRIVLPYRPRLILLYEGDNDIGNGETPDQVVADYRRFAKLVRTKLPGTHFAFLPIKPSLKRWNLWPEMKRANEAIQQLCAEDDYLHHLDTITPMLGEDGKPMPALFEEDGLHLNPAGYRAWTRVVSSWLAEHAPGS
jgi:lysophospholipase L1-like esterase